MTQQEKVNLAKEEVKQAELMIGLTKLDLAKWEAKLDLRREMLKIIEASK